MQRDDCSQFFCTTVSPQLVMGREEVSVSFQRLRGYHLYKGGNGDEVTKAKGKKEHGVSSGNCAPTILLEIARVLGAVRDEAKGNT